MAGSFSVFSYYQISLIAITAVFILSPSLFPATIAAANSLSPKSPFSKIYAFGDSFTDTGNTKTASGPTGFGHVSNSPYGITYFHRPTNRYSDGRLVIDFVTQSLSLPFLPPYLHNKDSATTYGVNFAVGGATAINHAFFVQNNLSLDITPQSIQTQLLWFNKFLESKGCKEAAAAAESSSSSGSQCQAAFDDALFWVGEIGVNDYAYTLGSTVSSVTIQKLAISSFTNFLQTLLKMGAKYVVVQGLPPTGCLPLALYLSPEDDRDDLGCVKSVNNKSYSHNVVLQAKLQNLRKQFPQAVIVYADYASAYRTVMKNPGKYGFKEPFKACCGSDEPPYNFNVFATCGMPSAKACQNPHQYINWDGVHLTEAMYKVVSDMFLNGTFSTPPFSYLLSRKQRDG